jgi:hypothetical protein
VDLSGEAHLIELPPVSRCQGFRGKVRRPVGQTVDDLILLAECSFDGEWEGQVRFLPL